MAGGGGAGVQAAGRGAVRGAERQGKGKRPGSGMEARWDGCGGGRAQRCAVLLDQGDVSVCWLVQATAGGAVPGRPLRRRERACAVRCCRSPCSWVCAWHWPWQGGGGRGTDQGAGGHEAARAPYRQDAWHRGEVEGLADAESCHRRRSSSCLCACWCRPCPCSRAAACACTYSQCPHVYPAGQERLRRLQQLPAGAAPPTGAPYGNRTRIQVRTGRTAAQRRPGAVRRRTRAVVGRPVIAAVLR